MQGFNNEPGDLKEIFESFSTGIPEELRDRLFHPIEEDPKRRLTSEDMVELAQIVGVEISKRQLHDMPVWGLLALSTPEGRGPGGGVGRTWSVMEAVAFVTVMQARARGKTRRNELANIPVSFWLLLGADAVPLAQARRALATWTRGLERLSEHRARTDHYHHLLHRSDVGLAIERDPAAQRKLVEELRDAPPHTQRNELAAFLGRLRGPLAERASEAEAKRFGTRYQDSLVALQVGIDVLKTAPDAALLEVRRRYFANFENKLEQMLGSGRTSADEIRTFIGVEMTTACPNTLTYLGALTQEADGFAHFEFSIAADRAAIAVATSLAVREVRRQINEDIAASGQRIARHRKRRRLPTTF